MRWKAVIFDLDDTLYPERAYVASGYQAVGHWAQENLGIPAPLVTAELNELFDAGVRTGTFDRWLETRGLAPEHATHMVTTYRNHDPQITPFLAIPPLLAQLRQHVPLGLVTDGRAKTQRAKMAALGLTESFDAITYSEEHGDGAAKPSPLVFLSVLRQLSMADSDAFHAVYIADNPAKDFLGARRASVSSIRLRLEGGIYASSEPPSPDHSPDAEVRNLLSLEHMLMR